MGDRVGVSERRWTIYQCPQCWRVGIEPHGIVQCSCVGAVERIEVVPAPPVSRIRPREGASSSVVAGLARQPALREVAVRTQRPCPVCGEVFEPRRVGGKWTKSCSKACANALTAKAMREGGSRRASLARRRPEKVALMCEVCGKTWKVPPSQVRGRRTCSRACCSELRRREMGGGRRGERNPNWKGGQRAGVRNRSGERRWYEARRRCCEHPDCAATRGLALHHIVYRQAVCREGGDEWDPRNALTLCERCHASHHGRGRWVVPVWVLSDDALAFAVELLGRPAAFEYLRRRYRGEDVRLDELLAAA